MRFTQTLTAALAVLCLGTTLPGQTRAELEPREGDQAASPCLMLVRDIGYKLSIIDRSLAKIQEMTRNIAREDQSGADLFVDAGLEHKAKIREQFETVLSSVGDRGCLECLVSSCEQIAPKLTMVKRAADELLNRIREHEQTIRQRLYRNREVVDQICKTDRILYGAMSMVRKTGDGEDAFPALRRAFELQESAKQALAAGKLEMAFGLTIRARDLVGMTVRAALDSVDVNRYRERMKKFWEQTNVLIRRLDNKIDEEEAPRAHKLLEMAKEEQAKAREMMQDHPYRAMRHAKQARSIVMKVARFGHRVSQLGERLDKVDERMERAGEIVEESDDQRAADVLAKAKEHHEKAAELAEQGKDKAATVQVDIAVKLAAKAVDIAKGVTRKDKAIHHEIRKTTRIVNKAGSMAETDAQKRQVETAKELIEKAGEQTDNPKAALKLLDKATDIAFRVIAQAGRPDKPERPDERPERPDSDEDDEEE